MSKASVEHSAPTAAADASVRARDWLPYLLAGVAFGVIIVKAEVISWYRIQEMFRFDSFHMYGIMGSAWLTALISLQLLRRLGARSASGDPIGLPAKELDKGHRYWIGGATFGVGWAFTGACPGPLFALIGSGPSVYMVTAAAALAGARTYGYFRDRLPH